MFKQKKIILCASLFLVSFGIMESTFAADNIIKKIYKVEAYKSNELGGYYELIQGGSAVLIGKNKVITNAHVVLDEEDKPLGNYNLCISDNFENKPKCLYSMKLKEYDLENDLAILVPAESGVELGTPVTISSAKLEMGDSVKVYGYPSNGGSTITFTEGKISGKDKNSYKIDANIDSGNSGGGAFDKDGKLLGIPYVASVGLSTLGYVIPVETINQFLSGKTSVEIFDKKDDNFSKFIKSVNGVINSQKYDGFFKVNDPRKYGFEISDMKTTSGNIGYVDIYSKNQETSITVSSYLDSIDRDVDMDFSGAILEKYYKESYDKVVYRKTLKLGGRTFNDFVILKGDKKRENPDYIEVYYKINNIEVSLMTEDYAKNKRDFSKGFSYIMKGINAKGGYNYSKLESLSLNGASLQLTDDIVMRRSFDSYGELSEEFRFLSDEDFNTLKFEVKELVSFEDKNKEMTMTEFFKEVDKFMPYEEKQILTNEIKLSKNNFAYRLFVAEEPNNAYFKKYFLVQFVYEKDGKFYNGTFKGSSFMSSKEFEDKFYKLVDTLAVDGTLPFKSYKVEKVIHDKE